MVLILPFSSDVELLVCLIVSRQIAILEASQQKHFQTECAKLTLDIPFLDQLCDKFGEKEVNLLYNLIMKEGGKIDPEKDCRAIRFC